MYHQQNQYQNKPNYAQNYGAPITQNTIQGTQNNQYQYQGYTIQPPQTTYVGQTQYQPVQNVQNIKNPTQIPLTQNYQNIQQPQQHFQTTVQPRAQNIQYAQKPEQKIAYAYGHQAQIPLTPQYNIKTNAIDGNQYINVQIPTNNYHKVVGQNPISNQPPTQVMQVTNQVVQPQPQKMIFHAPKPLTGTHNSKMKSPLVLENPKEQNQTAVQPKHHNNIPNQQINNQVQNVNINKASPAHLNNTVNPIKVQTNPVEPKFQIQPGKPTKAPSLMTIHSLAGEKFENFPVAEYSSKPVQYISGYGANSYNGKYKTYNEDKVKVIYNHIKNFEINGKSYNNINISYFGVFDGHGGEKCSDFLLKHLHNILFSQPEFPQDVINSVRKTFITVESEFRKEAVFGTKLNDKSGSCALIALIINDVLYTINLGDSRALCSKNTGNEFIQLTRDHKPDDPKEKARIEKAGGKVYYANKVNVNGKIVELKEEDYGGFKFPYRLSPSGLAVRNNKF